MDPNKTSELPNDACIEGGFDGDSELPESGFSSSDLEEMLLNLNHPTAAQSKVQKSWRKRSENDNCDDLQAKRQRTMQSEPHVCRMSGSTSELINKAYIHYMAGEYQETIAVLNQVIQQHPGLLDAFHLFILLSRRPP